MDIMKDRARQKAKHYIRLAEEPKEEMIRDYSKYKKPAHIPYEVWFEKVYKMILEEWAEREN